MELNEKIAQKEQSPNFLTENDKLILFSDREGEENRTI